MVRLEELTPGTVIRGILPDAPVTVLSVQWYGDNAVELTYKDGTGRPGSLRLRRTTWCGR